MGYSSSDSSSSASSSSPKKHSFNSLFSAKGSKTKKLDSLIARFSSMSTANRLPISFSITTDMTALLEFVGGKLGWTKYQIEKDCGILSANLISNLSDLALLSSSDWKSLSLEFITKDILMMTSAAFRKSDVNGNSFMSSLLSVANGITIQEAVEKIKHENQWKQPMEKHIASLLNHRICHQRDLLILSIDSWNNLEIPVMLRIALRAFVGEANSKAKQFSTAPGSIIPIVQFNNAPKSNRIVVESEGKKYEVDRFCPHKGADLSQASVKGGILVCPKHKWKFDLTKGGECTSKDSCSLNATAINDW